MKKKGFTLVELLAVIAILAILAIIALPNVMKMMNDSKKNSFTVEATEILKTAKQQWLADSMGETKGRTYSNVAVVCADGSSCTEDEKLPLDGRNINYAVTIDGTGKVTDLFVSDGTYYLGTGGQTDITVSMVGSGSFETMEGNSPITKRNGVITFDR